MRPIPISGLVMGANERSLLKHIKMDMKATVSCWIPFNISGY